MRAVRSSAPCDLRMFSSSNSSFCCSSVRSASAKAQQQNSVDLSAVFATSDNISAAAPSAACLAMLENTSADMCWQFTVMSENVKQFFKVFFAAACQQFYKLFLLQYVCNVKKYFCCSSLCSVSAISENIFAAVLSVAVL